MRNPPTKEEIDEITKLFLYGESMNFLALKFKKGKQTIKDILNQQGLTAKSLRIKSCANCGNLFLTNNPTRLYCHNPCDGRYDREANVRFWAVRILRSHLAQLIKSNPDSARRLKQEMIKEEGQEYADLIFGKLLNSQLITDMSEVYDKYKHLWSNQK